jgi:hypothetical protein
MDPENMFDLILDIEMSFGALPLIVLLTFGNGDPGDTWELDAFNTSSGPVVFRRLPAPMTAIYNGGVQQLVGQQVNVIGLCDCLRCHTATGDKLPHYITQLPGTGHVIVHSRATSYLLIL